MSDPKTVLDGRAEAFVRACSASPPNGGDVRYDPQFEALQKEIGKLEDPAGGPPDWFLVERDATQITADKSKDLLVLAWLTAAMHERGGAIGLATGLWAISTLVEQQWEGIFPPLARIKGRASALTWLVGRAVMKLESDKVLPTHDELDALSASVRRAASVIPDRYGDHAPGLRPLSDAVERVRLSMPARPAAAAPAAAPAPAATPAPAAAPAAAPAPAVAPAAAPAAPTPAAPPAAAAPEPSRVDVLEARIAPYLTSIAGASPAGEDLRYDPEHEWLRAEVAKLENPGGGQPDWKEVERRASALVEKRSKDLLVASYLAWSMAEREGVEGLATGLLLLGGVMGAFWEPLHPLRAKGRTAALVWLLARIDQAFSQPTPMKGGTDREIVSRLELAARVFVSMVRDKFVEDPPPTRPLLDSVERLKMSLPAPKAAAPPPAAAPPAQAPAAQPSAPTPAPTATATVATPAVPTLAAGADVTPFLQQSGTALIGAATALRGASPGDPNAYRIHRTGLYLAMAAAPPATQGPKTALRPPPPQLRTQLQTLSSNAKWAALLEEAEPALGMNRYWLDLHRYVVLALEGLSHAAAAQVVVAETAHLVRRFPTLETLQFSDGTALASGDTIEWLATIGGAPGGGKGGGGDAGDAVGDVVAAAKTLANGGKRDEALKNLQDAVRSAPDDRARFRLRLGLARLCAQGSPNVARGLLDGLCRDIETQRIDAWDPALAADALRAYHELLRDGAKTNPRVAEEAAEVYRRLCRIDVTLAIAAGG